MEYADSQIVDEDDNIIGQMQLPDAMKQGKILQVSRLFLFNKSGQLLLQKRGPNVLAPNAWNESAAGHVDAGETYLSTVKSETEEELGIVLAEFQEIDYMYTDGSHGEVSGVKRFQKVYKAVVEDDIVITPEADEVADTRWISLEDLDAWVQDSPSDFTGGFKLFYSRFRASASQ